MEERLCFHKHDFGISVEWISVPCDCIVGAIKTAFSKRSLQMYLNNQILDYNAILHLCENEMMLISFFGICKKIMITVENLEIQKWYECGETVPVTRNSHHLVPLSSSRIGPKLIIEDESYVDIYSISLCDLYIQLVLVGWHG